MNRTTTSSFRRMPESSDFISVLSFRFIVFIGCPAMLVSPSVLDSGMRRNDEAKPGGHMGGRHKCLTLHEATSSPFLRKPSFLPPRLAVPPSSVGTIAHSSIARIPPSSVGIHPQGGSDGAHLPAFAVIGFSSGWARISREQISVPGTWRRGENGNGDSASGGIDFGRSTNARSSLASIASSSVAIDYAGIGGEKSIKRLKQYDKYR